MARTEHERCEAALALLRDRKRLRSDPRAQQKDWVLLDDAIDALLAEADAAEAAPKEDYGDPPECPMCGHTLMGQGPCLTCGHEAQPPSPPQAEPAPEPVDDDVVDLNFEAGRIDGLLEGVGSLNRRLAALEHAQVRTGKSVTELWQWRDSHGKVQCDIDNAIFKRLDALEARLAGQGEVPEDLPAGLLPGSTEIKVVDPWAERINFLLAEARQRRATKEAQP